MPDKEARALGVASGMPPVTIAGKECRPRPLGAAELLECERVCLDEFKQDYMRSYKKNLPLIVEDPKERHKTLLDKLDEVSRWDTGDLPLRTGYDPSRIKITKKLRHWLRDTLDVSVAQMSDQAVQRNIAGLLEEGTLSPNQYKRFVGELPRSIKVPYVNWWITGSYEGKLTFIWMAFRDGGVTKEEVAEFLAEPENTALLNELAFEVESLSAPKVGNG